MLFGEYRNIDIADIAEALIYFHTIDNNSIPGAEPYCWPDETVDHLYPSVGYTQSRFLNSGMFIGKSKRIGFDSFSDSLVQ